VRLPSSNIEVTYENEVVIVRDENTSKFIEIGGMTFEDILSEVQSFAYIRNCRPPRRLLRFILLRTGLPEQEQFPRHDILDNEDLNVLEDALESVDDLTDNFRSSHGHQMPVAQEETEIPAAPNPEEVESERTSIWTSDTEVEMVYRFNPENVPKRAAEESVEQSKAALTHDALTAEFDIFDESSSMGLTRLKVLFLGEQGVGKRNILQRAGFSVYEAAVFGSLQTDNPLAYSKILGHHAEKIRVDVWLPEGTAEARLPIEEFYAETGVIALVYSTSDRTSFERIEFWIEEASSMFLVPVPVLLIANKRNGADSSSEESSIMDSSVSSEEGIELRNKIAEILGTPQHRFPIEYIEASSLGQACANEVIESILRLWEQNDRLILPIVESLV
jgi:GTPase SAR1 family protein